MFKVSCTSFFVIALIVQFHTTEAFDWLEFFDRWIFGSNKLGQISYSKLLLVGEDAEKRFIDNEVHKVSKPKILKAQIEHNTLEINKWYEYHKNANFIMRYIARWAMDTLFERREHLYEQLEQGKIRFIILKYDDGSVKYYFYKLP